MRTKKIRIGNKAIATAALVKIIISIISFTLLATTIGQFMSGSDIKQQENLCQSSISLRATSALQLNSAVAEGNIKAAPVLCKTIDIKSKTEDREKIKRLFAEKIAKCWWMFGEGRYNEILSGSEFHAVPSLLGINNQPNECFNCYNIMIDVDNIDPGDYKSNDEDNYPIGRDELIQFMREEHPVKTKTRCRPKNEKLCKKELTENFPESCKDDKGYDCWSCEIDSDCNQEEHKGKDLRCEKGICEKDVKLNYLQYIQSYGGPGMFVNILPKDGIQARHAYSISILPKNVDKEQTNWMKVAGYTALGASAIMGFACGFTGVGCVLLPIAGKLATFGAGAALVGESSDLMKGVEDKDAPTNVNVPNAGTQISVESMFKERLVTSVYLSETKWGQAYCGSGDLAGQ